LRAGGIMAVLFLVVLLVTLLVTMNLFL